VGIVRYGKDEFIFYFLFFIDYYFGVAVGDGDLYISRELIRKGRGFATEG